MAGDNLEDVLVEKGLPAETVEKIDVHEYTSIMGDKHSTTSYNPDRIFYENDLENQDTDLTYIGVDLDQNKVCYYDKFGHPKISYSEDDFQTSMLLDFHNVSWVVDRVDDKSYYFNTELNEFIPNYNPEIVDPADFISQIWKETKRQAKDNTEVIEIFS